MQKYQNFTGNIPANRKTQPKFYNLGLKET